jgi:ribosomal-protein-alanine acetyltransferase
MNPIPAAVEIRRMSAAEVDRVMELARRLKEAPAWPASAYLAALDPQAAPRRIALVAAESESGALGGFLVAALLPPQGELETIAVVPEARRRGVGRRLFAALVEELKTEGVAEVILEVRASNRAARAFYASLGFAETGRRPRYYEHPQEDALLLTLRLA